MASFDDSVDTAMGYYKQGAQAAQQELSQQQTAGQTALTTGVTQADVYTDPYRQAGEQAVGTYSGALGLGTPQQQQSAFDSYTSSPGFKWATEQATQGIERSNAAKGLTGSGAEQKELANYITGAASQDYNQWLGQLAGLTGTGQTSAESSAGRTFGAGGQIADLNLGYGQATAGIITTLAQAAADAEMAKALGESQDRAGVLGLVGDVAGAVGGGLTTGLLSRGSK